MKRSSKLKTDLKMKILALIVIMLTMFPNIGYSELLNSKSFEFVRTTTFTDNAEVNSDILITTSQDGATGHLRCYSGYDGSLYFDGSINETVKSSQSKKIYSGSSITCTGTITPVRIDSILWTVYVNGSPQMQIATNVTHADCSADVQNIVLGVMPPGTSRTVSLPVSTTGGMLLLTSPDMSDGIIKMGGKDDMTIHPGDNISQNNAGGWTGITGDSTINVETSTTASGVYNSSATVTLRCI